MGGEVVVWAMVGVFAVLLVLILLLGIFYPGTGAEQLRWRPTRSPELEAENEIDDMTQMLEATNAKRRARGLEPLTEEQMHARVREDAALRRRLRRDDDADAIAEELRQLDEAREARRRRRGGRER
jgi:hypothetical protein